MSVVFGSSAGGGVVTYVDVSLDGFDIERVTHGAGDGASP